MIFNETPRRKQINELVAWGHWFAFANILMAIVISSVYLLSSPIANTPLSILYMVLTWLGHISFITFFGFVLLLLPLCYQLKQPRLLKAIGSFIAAVGLALLAFDALLYNKTGFHISFRSAELLRSETEGQMGAFSWLQWFYLLLLIVVWLMFQLVLANAIHKRIKRFMKVRIGAYVSSAFVACFVLSHAIHVWADAKLYAPVLQQDNMLPLSYPATAKTLMSRIGVFDLQDYRQRQTLQFNDTDFSLTYPPKPIYCSVDSQQKLVFISVQDSAPTDLPDSLTPYGFHFVSNTLNDQYLQSVVYGLPQALLASVSDSQPVLLALAKAFNLDVTMHDHVSSLEQDSANKPYYSTTWEAFSESVNATNNGLFFANISLASLADIDLERLSDSASIILVTQNDTGAHHQLYSNIPLKATMSTTEDIAPTILQQLGCNATPSNYSIGQSLQSPVRTWAVSTQGRHLVVVHDGLITEVSKDGSFEIRDYMTNEKVLTEIDTNLLSRSIKHITEFSKR
jgi:membrane-anchored protein YejM (alkaline phosphatase superfamily)